MQFDTYYKSLPLPEREALALRAGTSRAYIENHLAVSAKRRKVPRKGAMIRLAGAVAPAIKPQALVLYFYDMELESPIQKS